MMTIIAYTALAAAAILDLLIAMRQDAIALKNNHFSNNRFYAWLRESDVVIAECTCPSLGVGYELAYAEHLEIPVHVFYNPSKCSLSAMITGDSYFHIHPYSSKEEIFTTLNSIL